MKSHLNPIPTLGIIALALVNLPSAKAFTLVAGTDQMEGWQFDDVPVFLNPEGCTVSTDQLVSAIEEAAFTWNAVTTSRLRLSYGGEVSTTYDEIEAGTETQTQAGPVIVCATNMSEILGTDSKYIPAATGTGFLSRTQLSSAFMVLNAEEGKSAEISNIQPSKLGLIIAHELGHAVGIGHTDDTVALMYYDATAKTTLRLGREDRAAVTYLYPRNEFFGDLPLGCGTVNPSVAGWGVGAGLESGLYLALARWACSRRKKKVSGDRK